MKKNKVKKVDESIYVKDFIDMISPSIIKFFPSYYVFGNTYRQVLAIKNYTLIDKNVALLRRFGESKNIIVKVIAEKLNPIQYEKKLENSINKHLNETKENNKVGQVKANTKLSATQKLIEKLTSNGGLVMYSVNVYLELISDSRDNLNKLRTEVVSRLNGVSFDDMYMNQKEGFLAVNPVGNLKNEVYQRHMDTESLSNLFPFSYSGKIDSTGMRLGKDKFGGKIIIDFDKRSKTRTNSNILILGNSGEGKSFTVKSIIVDWRKKRKKIISLDPEGEYKELTESLGGYYVDLMEGKYIINVLEVRKFKNEDDDDIDEEEKISSSTNLLSQHLSFLRDFFRAYKNFNESELDGLEILLAKTYEGKNINYDTDIESLKSEDFPILSDLYDSIQKEIDNYDKEDKECLINIDILQTLRLGLNSICKGADSRYFNGHTNVKSYDYLTFGVQGLLDSNVNLRSAMLFNILTFMANELLVEGNCIAILDEFYLFLDNLVMVKYIRNFMKRVRKKNSGIVISSQNIEDFLIKSIAEYTKPLFAIPTYKFLFYPGDIDRKVYCNLLTLKSSEFELIKSPSRGNCLFNCGGEKFNLQVEASLKKQSLFGAKGGN
ncbi:helicase HerA domain-containing protein [Clostridium thermobutyricum]|uniref:VirB4 family type IV secretion system protein n=1 Tax=Clostridium thermobutyricum TaxID=29372 RepID=UPI002942036E|nr:DUF87 domain-containing protein [Clostridium thermobutyricum]